MTDQERDPEAAAGAPEATDEPATPAEPALDDTTASATTGPTPVTFATRPNAAVAIVITPNTIANRRLTTRAISSGGVRSWNSVWLGMTNAMLAMPMPNMSESRIGRGGMKPTRKRRTPNAV